ncbi:MAG: DUF6873 family GME fold protein [Bacteroidota bacterium]
MLIIADGRLPADILKKLSEKGKVVLLQTDDIVYDSISGHPDIFICPTPSGLIVAPKTPGNILEALTQHKIPFVFGEQSPGKQYPDSIPYNAVITRDAIIHNRKHSDKSITKNNPGKEIIHVAQGYTKCNLIPLTENTFITSDRGIEKALQKHYQVYWFSPENIQLRGQKHGFLGGCAGRWKNTLCFTGRLDSVPEHVRLKQVIAYHGLTYEELYDGPLIDGGGILFLAKNNYD